MKLTDTEKAEKARTREELREVKRTMEAKGYRAYRRTEDTPMYEIVLRKDGALIPIDSPLPIKTEREAVIFLAGICTADPGTASSRIG